MPYYQAFVRLKEEIEKSTSESADTTALKSATASVEKSLPDEWTYFANAMKYETSNPNIAEKYFKEGLTHFENSAALNGQYAIFLVKARKDFDTAEIHFKRSIGTNPIATALGNYALFLWKTRKNFEAAESHFKRALDADPNDGTILSNYASFLQNVHKEMGAAETYFKRALGVDPNNANTIGNYAQFVLGMGRNAEGHEILNRAFTASANLPNADALRIELLIYRYAYDKMQGSEALTKLKRVLADGQRTPDWNFDLTLDRAAKDGHSNLALLTDLTKVANDHLETKVLEKYPEWLAA
jgi:Tfp pilus assembly protein PilF